MPTKMNNFMFEWLIVLRLGNLKLIGEAIAISLIQHFEADFLWKVSLKILNSGFTVKTFTHVIGASSYALNTPGVSGIERLLVRESSPVLFP